MRIWRHFLSAWLVPTHFSTSFQGSLLSAFLGRWNRDPGCSWSPDHLSIQNRRVGGYSSTFGREDDKIPHPSSRFFYHPDSGWSRDQPQLGSLFQRLWEGEKRDPGNEVAHFWCAQSFFNRAMANGQTKKQGQNNLTSRSNFQIKLGMVSTQHFCFLKMKRKGNAKFWS